MAATSGSANAAPLDSTVMVHGCTQGLTIQHGQVHAGLVRFLIDTTNDQGSNVVMFTPATGETVNKVLADLHDEFVRRSPHGGAGHQGTCRRCPVLHGPFPLPLHVLPKAGIISVSNVGGTIHLMHVSPVKQGTTDNDIQRFFDSHDQGEPPFALDGPTIEMGTLSPGRHADITYSLPAGTYVLQCLLPTTRPACRMRSWECTRSSPRSN